MSTPAPAATIDATDANFQQTVVDASHQVPMLVDFWAPWCEPCKVLGPVLEKLATEYEGRFNLVKVNMDENPMLAQALAIRSIPAVKLIMNGEIRDEFMGAYPEPEVRKFLDRNLPGAADGDAMEGLKAYAAGDRARAQAIFQATLAEDPGNSVALIGMGNLALEQGSVEEARKALAAVSETDIDNLVEKALAQKALAVLRARLLLLDNAGALEHPPGPPPGEGAGLESRFTHACRLALEGAYEDALQALLDIVREDRTFKDDGARKAMLAVFDLLPPDSPHLASYRTRLSSLLFS